MDWFHQFFSEVDFMPHGHCYLWNAPLVWTHVIADTLIALSYGTISFLLYSLVKKIQLPFSSVVLAFGLFIAACGSTHVMEIWNLWHSSYWVASGVKTVTAIASVATALWLIKLGPHILNFAKAAKLSEQRRHELEFLTKDLENQVELRSSLLLASEERFRSTFELAAVGIAHIDVNGRWLLLNQKYSEILGYTENELLQLTFRDVTHPDDLPSDAHFFERLLKREIPSYTIEKRYIRKDKSIIWVHLTVSSIPLPLGGPDYIIAVVQDISERKLFDEERGKILLDLKEAIRARDEFISIAGHELKTPLTAIKLQSQVLERKIKKGHEIEQEHFLKALEQMDGQMNRLTRLVEDMLDISRISTGRLNMEMTRINLSELVQETLQRTLGQDVQRPSLFVRLDPQAQVRGDAFRLEQIVVNLLTNALKYGEGRPIEVDVTTELEGKSKVVLKVRDYGIGISSQDQLRIFERFERAISASSISGLGIGLYIVKQILLAHEGEIFVDSALGQGSLFTVTFPYLPPSQEMPYDSKGP